MEFTINSLLLDSVDKTTFEIVCGEQVRLVFDHLDGLYRIEVA